MWYSHILAIILCVVLGHATSTIAAVSLFTTTHTYMLGDDDSRNSARQKCLAEAKRKILEQVGIYLESQSDLLTSARSTTSDNVKSPQTTSEERQQLTERITTLTAGLMRTEIVKEEFGEVNGRVQITLTVNAEVDPDDIQKQLANQRVERSVTNRVTEQEQRLARIEERLRAITEQEHNAQRAPSTDLRHSGKKRKMEEVSPDAIATTQTLANQGDPVAQFVLGLIYERGAGLPQSDKEAVVWYRKSADARFAQAQVILGNAYENGRGVPKSDTDAVFWYQKAAEQHGVWAQLAQTLLGYSYSSGRGVTQSAVEAVKWWRKAAASGEVISQYRLGQSYYLGEGVSQSDLEAVKWWRKAAEQGDAPAQRQLGGMYSSGRGVQKSDSYAVMWYRKAADQGDTDAQKYLGEMYQEGRGVSQSDAEAVKWYRKAADLGDAEAKRWFRHRKAARLLDANARDALFAMYEQGHGVLESNWEASAWFQDKMSKQGEGGAANWFRKAAQGGNANAQVVLGILYYEGYGVQKSQADAIAWYRRAADMGHAFAQQKLGSLYAMGWEDGPQNFVDGYIWCYRAAVSASDEELTERATTCQQFCAQQLSPGQLSDAKRTAKDWKPTHAH